MDGSVVMRGAEILTDIHHGISSLATMRALASMSGDPSERRWPTCWLRAPPPGALPITLGVGEVKIRSFLGNRWAVLPGVERLSKWPKLTFHGVTPVPHQESLSSCRQAIMGQRSIGAGFHTFLRRAVQSFRRADLIVDAVNPCETVLLNEATFSQAEVDGHLRIEARNAGPVQIRHYDEAEAAIDPQEFLLGAEGQQGAVRQMAGYGVALGLAVAGAVEGEAHAVSLEVRSGARIHKVDNLVELSVVEDMGTVGQRQDLLGDIGIVHLDVADRERMRVEQFGGGAVEDDGVYVINHVETRMIEDHAVAIFIEDGAGHLGADSAFEHDGTVDHGAAVALGHGSGLAIGLVANGVPKGMQRPRRQNRSEE